MYLGQIIDTGATEQLFQSATHPYTQALISSIPLPDPRKERSRVLPRRWQLRLRGDGSASLTDRGSSARADSWRSIFAS